MSSESSSHPELHDKDPLSSQKTSHPEELPQESSHNCQMSPLEWIVAQGTDREFEQSVPQIGSIIRKETQSALSKNKMLHYRMMKMYYRMYKKINGEQEQEYIVFVLSLLAEIIRQNQDVRLPFTKNIVLSLLTFDYDNLKSIECRHQIVMIMTIIYENMARQGRQMVRLGVQKQVKEGLLLLLSKVDDFFVLRILLKGLIELQAKTEITFNTIELQKCRILSRVRDVFGDMAAEKIKNLLCRTKLKKVETISNMTLFELISCK